MNKTAQRKRRAFMYTVLLVDDEMDILNNLLNQIDWPVYGIGTVLTARDGLEALAQFKKLHIDLLITDISMPEMDGLALIRKVHEMYSGTRCILLTSYSDFAYAKEAISLGVENYLLKPFNAEELDNSIRKSLDNISMHKHVMQSIFMDNILYRWATNDISSDELSERSKHIGINIYSRNYCTVLIRSMHKRSMDHILGAFFSRTKSQYTSYHFVNYDGYHVIIIGGHSISQQSIADSWQEIISDNSFESDFQATIGIVVEGFEDVSRSYQSALEYMLLSHSPASQPIMLAYKNTPLELTSYQLNLIIEHIKTVPASDSDEDVYRLYREIFPDLTDYSLREINAFIEVIPVQLGLQLCASGLIDSNAIKNIAGISYHFEEMPAKEEILLWFTNTISICQALVKLHSRHLSPIILTAMQYVSDNYSEYVSIKDFCNRHNMNASYLGLLFKKETGIYFNDYINHVRINQAISLVKNTNLKVAAICQKTGFTNTSYFIRCFKKQTGVSPARFKQLNANK